VTGGIVRNNNVSIAWEGCAVALQGRTVLLHCKEELYFCTARNNCIVALQGRTVLLHRKEELYCCTARKSCT
jgi:hypothetical protein